MTDRQKKYRVFISVADPSADAHCAALIKSVLAIQPNTEFVGVGGDKMAAAGCELLDNTVHTASMTYHAFAQVGYFYKLLQRIKNHLRTKGADIVVVCDSPAFNFHVAKAAKKIGLPTMFYVAPQLWAWASWRIKKLRKYCDKLCCILPFEEKWFTARDVNTTFVGNPLLDELSGELNKLRKKYDNYSPDKVSIALIPGSRSTEIKSLFPSMQQIAMKIKANFPKATFSTVAASQEKLQLLKQMKLPDFECDFSIDTVRATAAQVDFALVASGSATLEVACAGCPMVVMYQTNAIIWNLLGRWFIRPKYFSLINLLADRELVTEFMPYFSSINPIIETVEALIRDDNKLRKISNDMIDIIEPLINVHASDEAAKILLEMLKSGGVGN